MTKPRLKDRPEFRKEAEAAHSEFTLEADGHLTKNEELFLGRHNCLAVTKRKGLSYKMGCESASPIVVLKV